MEILIVLGIVADAFIVNVLYVYGGASFFFFTFVLAVLVSLVPHVDRQKGRWADGWLADFLMALAVIPPGVVIFVLACREWMP